MQEQRETYRNTVREALAITGSEEALAMRLKVAPELVRQWVAGAIEVPPGVFLDAVDIVVEAKIQEISGPRKSH